MPAARRDTVGVGDPRDRVATAADVLDGLAVILLLS
jgi:hypothetical protein